MDVQKMAIIAGIISTIIFAGSNIPMLIKAIQTQDLSSYSPANLILANLGNVVHWFYIANLPPGPIWFLHTFYTLSSALMLLCYFRYRNQWSETAVKPTDSLNFAILETQSKDSKCPSATACPFCAFFGGLWSRFCACCQVYVSDNKTYSNQIGNLHHDLLAILDNLVPRQLIRSGLVVVSLKI